MARIAILCTLSAIVIADFASPAFADCHLAPLKTYPCHKPLELNSLKAGDSSAMSPMELTTQSPKAERKRATPRRQNKRRTRQ